MRHGPWCCRPGTNITSPLQWMEGIVRRFWMLRPTQRGSQAGRTTYDGQASANQARSGEKNMSQNTRLERLLCRRECVRPPVTSPAKSGRADFL